MSDSRYSDNEASKRDIPSFIEPRPPLILNPFMRPKPQKGTNLMDLFEDSEYEEPELLQVYLRLKPCSKTNNLYEVRSNRYLMTSLDTTTAGHGRRTQQNVSKMYTFSHIFRPESDQKEIFERVVKENLRKLPEGKSFTLLTYGASGSGKTFTLMGTVSSPGLVPRSLQYVFKVVDAAQMPEFKPAERGADRLGYAQQDYELQYVKRLCEIAAPLRDKYRRMSTQLFNDLTSSNFDLSNRTKHYVWVSFIEIYNEGIYDLLAPGLRRTASKLTIREDSSGNVYVKGAIQVFVRSGEEAYDVMVAGKHNLQVAATGIHAQSSRSHCIFTITMTTETHDGEVRTSCVRLCDLAGCERQTRARNTGARMQESRAINSSLHVLERCLRTLRSRSALAKTTLVPYRESKLTRILGAGLSGTRGEAVSMVVTLNTSPEYANESRHVLQLAAVAKDIQINNTMSDYPSSLESSSQDTTVSCSDEVMKLRAENERLHFELVQAQSYIKELQACNEKIRAANADTMREVVEEARDITKQYYEAQIKTLREEIEECESQIAQQENTIEEYESRLAEQARVSIVGTPLKKMQIQNNDMMTEIAILKEKYAAEKLARELAEEEVQHLRTCIEERDEKTVGTESVDDDDVLSLSDSDNNDSEDCCSESLEPSLRKEDINRSRMIRQSIIDLNSFKDKSEKLLHEKFTDTLKDEQINNSSDNDCTYETGDDKTINEEKNRDVTFNAESDTITKTKLSRETYCVKNDLNNANDYETNDNDYEINLPNTQEKLSRGTYFVTSKANGFDKVVVTYETGDDKTINKEKNGDVTFNAESDTITKTKLSRETYCVKNDLNNANDYEINLPNTQEKLSRETYFVTSKANDFDKVENIVLEGSLTTIYTEQNTAINTIVNKTKEDSLIEDSVEFNKNPGTFVNKIIASIKESNQSNNSLDLFEHLEQATKTTTSSNTQIQDTDIFNIKIQKENRKFFNKEDGQNSPETPATVVKSKDKKIHSDNTDMTSSNKELIDNNKKQIKDYRSPSIVKEDASKDIEPNIIKKLLGNSINKQADGMSSVQKVKNSEKKQESIDMFEVDSPQPVNKLEDIVKEPVQNVEIHDNIQVTFAKQDVIVTLNEIKSINKQCPTKDEIRLTSKKCDEFLEPTNNIENKIISKNDSKITEDVKPVNSSQLLHNTIEEFENIYKDVTAPRATDFDLLVSQEIQNSNIDDTTDQSESDLKYNLRHKLKMDKPKNPTRKAKVADEEVLLENLSKCESKPKPTRKNLRLRRQKENDATDVEKLKLKDIVNLQNEFSDVTLDKPAPIKEVKDIASPEKNVDDENRPPLLGTQSCPSKSITRSRRKLFTPRAEALEEDDAQTGNSNERIQVPRPSYHRPRARRKL